MSMNVSIAQTNNSREQCLLWGLKDDEFDVWLKYHPNIFTKNEDELALLAGKLPLLLTAFDALLTRWYDLLSRASNPSILGFNVVEIIKAEVCQQGVVGKYRLPKRGIIKRKPFNPLTERKTLKSEIEFRPNKSWILFDPEIVNYPGVDMVLVTNSTLGINVAIAKTCSPLLPFFNFWGPLAEALNLQIKGLLIAPDNFAHEEDNVEIAFLRDVYNELWEAIESMVNRFHH
ncbi:hypothetical protein AC1031_016173 [Aphanomyces cochlioides]|nr:hypothetical protein AC1031_016173 [Aphanomyces cochlioides]